MTDRWWDPWDPPSLYSILSQFQFQVKRGDQGPAYQGPLPMTFKRDYLDSFFSPEQKEVLTRLPYTSQYKDRWEYMPPYSLTFLGHMNYSFFVVDPQEVRKLRAWDETDFQQKFEKVKVKLRELSWIEGNQTTLQRELGHERAIYSDQYTQLQRNKVNIIRDLYYTEAAIWTQVTLGYLVQLSIQAHAVLSATAPQRKEITENVVHELLRLQGYRNTSQRRGVIVSLSGTYNVKQVRTTERFRPRPTPTIPVQTTTSPEEHTTQEVRTWPATTTTKSTTLTNTTPLPTTQKSTTIADTTTLSPSSSKPTDADNPSDPTTLPPSFAEITSPPSTTVLMETTTQSTNPAHHSPADYSHY